VAYSVARDMCGDFTRTARTLNIPSSPCPKASNLAGTYIVTAIDTHSLYVWSANPWSRGTRLLLLLTETVSSIRACESLVKKRVENCIARHSRPIY
jgi:hypothetical protein